MQHKKVIVAALLALIAISILAGMVLAQNVTASITSPANGATISGKVDIQGTANGPDFGYYKVEYKSAQDWVLTDGVAKHTEAVTAGTLVTWDTTTVADGAYDLRVLVADVTGQYKTSQISVTVANGAAQAAAEAPRRGCLACHVQIAPDGRYTLGYEAINAGKEGGFTHPTLPNGFNTTFQQCMTCHSGSGQFGMSTIVHPVHMFSTTFTSHYMGNCFSCHEIKNGQFTVLSDKQTVNESGIIGPAPAAPTAAPAAATAAPTTAAAPAATTQATEEATEAAATVAATAAPAATATEAAEAPPAIPSGHPTSGCIACHSTGAGGAPQFPANHAAYTEAMCTTCHQRTP